MRATVLRLQGSGTTVASRGTTAQDVRYYRARCAVLPWGRGCKKLHPPLLPYRSSTRPGSHGTKTPEKRYYHGLQRYDRRCLRYYRSLEQYYRKFSSSRQKKHKEDNRGKLQSARERWRQGRKRVRDDSTRTFPTRTPS